MIQIQGRNQFENAARRAAREHMMVRRYETGCYEVTNTAKGHAYLVRFTRRNGLVFGQCTCKAGTPENHCRPLVCKHLFVAVIVHNAINAARRAAAVTSAPVAACDHDDPDCDWRNWQ